MVRISYILLIALLAITMAPGTSIAGKITDDLVGYWPLDGNVKDTIAGLGVN